MTILSTLLIIFGMNIGELLTMLGLLSTFIGGIIWINVKLKEFDVRIEEIKYRMGAYEKDVQNTTDLLKEETDKINERLDKKMDKMDSKIDHIVDTVNDIKINCVKRNKNCDDK